MAELREYGVSANFQFPLVSAGGTNFAVLNDTFATADTIIMNDRTTAGAVRVSALGNGLYAAALSAGLMDAKFVTILVKDTTATPRWEDQMILVETYGSTAAMHRTFPADVQLVVGANVTAGVSAAIAGALVDNNTLVSAVVDDALVNWYTTVTAQTSAIIANALNAAEPLDANVTQVHGAVASAALSDLVTAALTDFGASTLDSATVSAVVDDAINALLPITANMTQISGTDASAAMSDIVTAALTNFGVSTLDSATVSAAVDDALVNLGVSTLTAADVSAAVDDAVLALEPLDANVTQWSGTAVQAAQVSGAPRVDVAYVCAQSSVVADFVRSVGSIQHGAVSSAISNTRFISDLSEATDDHFNGRALIFITGNLARQAATVSAYSGSDKQITLTLTETPANGDQFIIV